MPLGRALQLQLLLPAGGDPRRGPWASVTHIRLIHVSTDHALHFHAGFAHPQWTMGQPEVTGLLGRNDDLWFATDLSACHSRFITQSVRANGQRRGGRSSAPSLVARTRRCSCDGGSRPASRTCPSWEGIDATASPAAGHLASGGPSPVR
jgi:hypothetical protein